MYLALLYMYSSNVVTVNFCPSEEIVLIKYTY